MPSHHNDPMLIMHIHSLSLIIIIQMVLQKYTEALLSAELHVIHPALLLIPQVGRHIEVLLIHSKKFLDFLQTFYLLVVVLIVAGLHDLGVIADHDDRVAQLEEEAVGGIFLDELVHHLEDGGEVVVDLLVIYYQRFL